MIAVDILSGALLSTTAALPATIHPTGSEFKALLHAGCARRVFPNPAGNGVAPPPSISSSADARLAFDTATRANTDPQIAELGSCSWAPLD